MNTFTKRVLALSLLCYGLALFLHGLAARGANPYGFDGVRGYVCLAFGWSTAMTGSWEYFLPWMANPVYFLAVLLCIGTRTRRWSTLFALGALVLAALTFRIDTMMVNEAGHRAAVRAGPGAWLWMTSMLVLAFGAASSPRASGGRHG